MAYPCPSCRRPIPDRKRPTCGYCNFRLPAHLLLSSAQRSTLDEMRLREARRNTERGSTTSDGKYLTDTGGDWGFVDFGGVGDCDCGGCD